MFCQKENVGKTNIFEEFISPRYAEGMCLAMWPRGQLIALLNCKCKGYKIFSENALLWILKTPVFGFSCPENISANVSPKI